MGVTSFERTWPSFGNNNKNKLLCISGKLWRTSFNGGEEFHLVSIPFESHLGACLHLYHCFCFCLCLTQTRRTSQLINHLAATGSSSNDHLSTRRITSKREKRRAAAFLDNEFILFTTSTSSDACFIIVIIVNMRFRSRIVRARKKIFNSLSAAAAAAATAAAVVIPVPGNVHYFKLAYYWIRLASPKYTPTAKHTRASQLKSCWTRKRLRQQMLPNSNSNQPARGELTVLIGLTRSIGGGCCCCCCCVFFCAILLANFALISIGCSTTLLLLILRQLSKYI